jgi:hypothetical protein
MREISWLIEELSAYHVVTYLFIQPVSNFSDCLRKPSEDTSTKLCFVSASCCSGSGAGFVTKLTYLVSVKRVGGLVFAVGMARVHVVSLCELVGRFGPLGITHSHSHISARPPVSVTLVSAGIPRWYHK